MALQIRRGLQADLPASPADGELLYATDTNKLYVGDGGVAQEISGGGGGGGATTLDGLTDVVISGSPSTGQVLKFNGTNWANGTDNTGNITNLDSLTDVAISNIAPGQVLKFDGFNWINSTDANTGLTSLSQDLSPSLGGNLNLSNNSITGTGSISISGSISGTSLQPSLPALGTTDARLVLGSTGTPSTHYVYASKASMVTRTVTDGIQAATINWSTSRGTLAAPTAVQPGDILGGNTSYAYDGSAYQFVGTLQFGSGGIATAGHVSGFAGLLLTSDANPAVQITYTFDGIGNFTSPYVATDRVSGATNDLTLSSATTVKVQGGGTFRLPRLSTSQISGLTPVGGDLVYNTNTNKVQAYQGSGWINLDGTP